MSVVTKPEHVEPTCRRVALDKRPAVNLQSMQIGEEKLCQCEIQYRLNATGHRKKKRLTSY